MKNIRDCTSLFLVLLEICLSLFHTLVSRAMALLAISIRLFTSLLDPPSFDKISAEIFNVRDNLTSRDLVQIWRVLLPINYHNFGLLSIKLQSYFQAGSLYPFNEFNQVLHAIGNQGRIIRSYLRLLTLYPPTANPFSHPSRARRIAYSPYTLKYRRKYAFLTNPCLDMKLRGPPVIDLHLCNTIVV